MQTRKVSEVFLKRFVDFEFTLRSTQSPLELVKVLANNLKNNFMIDGVGAILGKKVGGKFLVEQEISQGSYQTPEKFSEIASHVKLSFEMLLSNDQGTEGFVCDFQGTSYRVEVVFTKDNYVHLLYFAFPEGIEDSSDFNAFIGLFTHEWGWHQKLEVAHELIYKDDLTGLYNYRYLENVLDNEVARSSRFNDKFSLMFVDLDNFKSVNDVHGHLVGSELLRKISKEIQSAVREIDSVVRYGGDEFIVILLGTKIEQAYTVAERVRKFIEKYQLEVTSTTGEKDSIKVTASIGLSCFPEHGQTKEELLSIADSNMYTSKSSGKNCINVHGKKLDALKI
jgi:diguanylate cyclase (GGDEF)-like protein